MKHTFCVLLEIQSDDPRLSSGALNTLNSVRSIALTRAAILDALPHHVSRVIALLPVKDAKALMTLHDSICETIGRPAFHPPAPYVPPTRE